MRKNRNLILFPKFQIRLVALNLGIITVISGIFWVQIMGTFDELQTMAGLAGPGRTLYLQFLAYHVSQLKLSLGIAFILGAVGSSLFTLIFSHRFAGPLVRLKNYFRSISESENKSIPELIFRDGDFLSDIPQIINRAMERMEKKDSDKVEEKTAA